MSVTLSDAIGAIQTIAPLHLAESWDNVGLLIEPPSPNGYHRVTGPDEPPIYTACNQALRGALLTIDMTEAVVAEAVQRDCNLVIAYHPPLFDPINRLVALDANARVIQAAIRAGLCVYSPHTALDAAKGGVNDWLAATVGEAASIQPIERSDRANEASTYKVVVFVPRDAADDVREKLDECGLGQIGNYSKCSFNLDGFGTFRGNAESNPTIGTAGNVERVDEVRLEMICPAMHIDEVGEAIREVHPYEEPAFDVYPLYQSNEKIDTGQGRIVHLAESVSLDALIGRVKLNLGLDHVRVAAAPQHQSNKRVIGSVAVCPGAGGSLFKNIVLDLDVYLTGEMRHHDVLKLVEQGATVILTDHTHTERGYLPTLKQKLHEQLGDAVTIDMSKVDADPLRIV